MLCVFEEASTSFPAWLIALVGGWASVWCFCSDEEKFGENLEKFGSLMTFMWLPKNSVTVKGQLVQYRHIKRGHKITV